MSISDFSAKGLLDKHIVPWKGELLDHFVSEEAENKFKKFASLFKERLFVNLICFADETGIHAQTGWHPGSEVVGVVGYLSWRENWQVFCGKWQEVLERYEVPIFHFSEFNAIDSTDPNWPYRNWDKEKKRRFVYELIPIARDNTLLGVGGLVGVRDYNICVPVWLKNKIEHPYHICFQLFFDAILNQLKNGCRCGCEKPFAPGEQVAFFFDQQEQFKKKALDIFDEIKATKDTDNRIGSIAFVDKKNYLPLQAADLIAYRSRKIVTRILNGSRAVNEGSWDEALGTKDNIFVPYCGAKNLRKMVALETYKAGLRIKR